MSKMAYHTALGKGTGSSVAIGRRPQFFARQALHRTLKCSHDQEADFHQSEQCEKSEGEVTVPFDLVSKVTYDHFHFFVCLLEVSRYVQLAHIEGSQTPSLEENIIEEFVYTF